MESYPLPFRKHRDLLTLRSGHETRNGAQIRTPRKIGDRYVKTWDPWLYIPKDTRSMVILTFFILVKSSSASFVHRNFLFLMSLSAFFSAKPSLVKQFRKCTPLAYPASKFCAECGYRVVSVGSGRTLDLRGKVRRCRIG